MSSLSVLVIDDEPAVRQILAAVVTEAGYTVSEAGNVAEATAKLARGDIDVALCDIKMPDGNGIDLVHSSRAAGIDTAFIMVTAFASVQTAVEALRAGASDYILKPVRNEEVLHRLAQIENLQSLDRQNRALRRSLDATAPRLYRFVSPSMLEVERMVDKLAPTDGTVLIAGESGTGKGILARAIHDQSARREGPFVAVNCSAIPEQLLESEFFGYTRGAFTGAERARKGLFMQASGGTLFLDEMSELPLAMQAKLLNVIEDKVVRPVGGEQQRRVDTRIVVATNVDLAGLVRQGRFREDLLFRLNAFYIALPPLRARPADLRPLLRFLLEAAGNGGARAAGIDPVAEELLLAYPWPGNVRELQNVIQRARLLAEGHIITVADLPASISRAASAEAAAAPGAPAAAPGPLDDAPLHEQLRHFEAEVVRRAIDAAGGDRRLAAQRLGIGLSSLYRKLEASERPR